MTRLRSPIRRIGVSAHRWGSWQDKCRKAVQLRCHGVCEGCGTNMRPLEWAHLAGRNNKGIGEPWASHPALTAGLCTSGYGHVGCHDKIDRGLDPDLLNLLRFTGLMALHKKCPFWMSVEVYRDKPLDGIREAVRRLEEEGWEFDPERQEIVKGD